MIVSVSDTQLKELTRTIRLQNTIQIESNSNNNKTTNKSHFLSYHSVD